MANKTTLDQVVRKYMITAGYNSLHGQARLNMIAIDGLKRLHFDVTGVPKTTTISIDEDTRTAYLPDDFLSEVFVGVCNQGNLRPLGTSNRICLPRTYDDCGDLQREPTSDPRSRVLTDLIDNQYHYGTNQRNGQLTGELYGVGGGNNVNGYYRIDREYNRIVFSSIVASEVILEYLGDISTVDGQHLVHPFDEEALEAYISWKDIQYKKNVNLNEKLMRKSEWHRLANLAKMRHQSATPDQLLQTLRKANKQSPKF